ncbi:gem-associated protein 2-like isoform X2 [Leptotrombidium deliense]|uniref:Gem-associated protein 2 n=1 Tax=Leptotrombidium deliense TaxID=299467 RepID=A0A443SEM2_9ACAR|nr:gem-associated protein 2-like isoform X2 [Leptotrombidium deliense]
MDFGDDESDGDEGGMAPVLPVASFKKFDPCVPPGSGMDYLRRVQLEASRCPDVVIATIDQNKFKTLQTAQFDDNNGFIACPEHLKPPIEWQTHQVAEFSNLRFKISNIRKKLDCEEIQNRFVQNSSLFEELLKIKGRHIDQQVTFFETHEPVLSVMLRLSQHDIYKMLIDHFKYIQHAHYSYKRGLWIYALLVCLQKPLQSEVYSALRDISRSVSIQRSSESLILDSEIVNSLNLIICIIGRYFNQLDMIDQ